MIYPKFEEWYNRQLLKNKYELEKTYHSIQKDYDYWKQFIILNSLRRSARNFYLSKTQTLKLKLNILNILISQYEKHIL